MNEITLAAMADEMEKMALSVPTAPLGNLISVGTTTAKSQAKGTLARGVGGWGRLFGGGMREGTQALPASQRVLGSAGKEGWGAGIKKLWKAGTEGSGKYMGKANVERGKSGWMGGVRNVMGSPVGAMAATAAIPVGVGAAGATMLGGGNRRPQGY